MSSKTVILPQVRTKKHRASIKLALGALFALISAVILVTSPTIMQAHIPPTGTRVLPDWLENTWAWIFNITKHDRIGIAKFQFDLLYGQCFDTDSWSWDRRIGCGLTALGSSALSVAFVLTGLLVIEALIFLVKLGLGK